MCAAVETESASLSLSSYLFLSAHRAFCVFTVYRPSSFFVISSSSLTWVTSDTCLTQQEKAKYNKDNSQDDGANSETRRSCFEAIIQLMPICVEFACSSVCEFKDKVRNR